MKSLPKFTLLTVAQLLSVSLLVACHGCGSQESNVVSTTRSTHSQLDRTVWEIYFIQGSKVGYGHTVVSHEDRNGRPIVKIDGLNRLTVKRFGQRMQQDISFTTTETPDGKLLDFESKMTMGQSPMLTKGRVDGDKLVIQTTTQGKTVSTSLPWQPEYGGFYATEQSLFRQPMTPGEKRTVHALVAGFNQVATVNLNAKKFEAAELIVGGHELLRIDTNMVFPNGQSMPGVMWTDRLGNVLKSRSSAMNLESYRATKGQALDKTGLADLDLALSLSVATDRPIHDPHGTKQIKYLISLKDRDPIGVFASCQSQSIKPLTPQTAELTVYSLRPDDPMGNTTYRAAIPTDAHTTPNNMMQSDNPKIVAMAKEAGGDEKSPWKTALALERYVNRTITNKDFSQAFATAVEVAESRVGDCTEHAVLLSALARARGIPSRVAIGLVYMEGTQSFGYHMWSEVYVNKRWIPIDATLSKGGIGAAHIKLAHSSLEGTSAYTSIIPLMHVAGQLKIKVLEIDNNATPDNRINR